VSRFATQKGFDLIEQTARGLMALDVTLAVLGSAASSDEARYEQIFRDLQAAYPGRVGVKIGYDNALAHRIEAGSDIFLMPSRYEPCGLNQMYSLRYGTPPVVRATGGLNDTIDETVGFKFQGYTAWEMLDAVRAAVAAYADRDAWTGLMRRGMARDYSWEASAREYGRLYNGLGGSPRR
jgi:starch synthase